MKHSPTHFLFVLTLLLSACQSAFIPDLVTRSGEKLFWDDFSDASGNWSQASSPAGSLGIDQGVYRIQVLTSHYEALATPGQPFQDVRVEVDTMRLGGPMQNLIGLACRSIDQNNFYFFTISSDGYYAIGKIKDGTTGLLGQEMMAQSAAILQDGKTNHLRFDCIGETLKGFVNDQLVANGKDPEFSSGEVGLVAGTLDAEGADVAFDNFVVYKP
jgi:hypothetical protein